MHLTVILPFILVGALAQSQNSTYLTEFIQALAAVNLTDLAGAAAKINNTAQGEALLARLSASSLTVFAPDNNAFAAVPISVTSNATLLADIISYHVVDGNFTSNIATTPNNTVGRTFLDDPSQVKLEGNKSQVLVFNKATNGTIEIADQPSPVTVVSTATFSNLAIYVIPSVITVPTDLPDVLTYNGLTSFVSVVQSVPGVVGDVKALQGFTCFAPNNDAITAAQPTIASLGSNTTLLKTVLQNHFINGTSYYSTEISSSENLTSAAGESLTFVSNSSGLFVLSANVASAKVLKTDLVTSNGVVHVIDTMLANTASDPAAASSAFASAASAAGQTSISTSSSKSSSTSSQKSGQVVSIGIDGRALIGLGLSALCVLLSGLSVL